MVRLVGGAWLLRPALYLVAFACVLLLLLSAVDISPDIIDRVRKMYTVFGKFEHLRIKVQEHCY